MSKALQVKTSAQAPETFRTSVLLQKNYFLFLGRYFLYDIVNLFYPDKTMGELITSHSKPEVYHPIVNSQKIVLLIFWSNVGGITPTMAISTDR